jgi:chromate transporter
MTFSVRDLTDLAMLFWSFAKIGPSSFGGGYAMMPAIEREVVLKRGWFTENEMADIISLAGTAPGGVGVNAAAFIGFRKAGFLGAAAAVAGITLPTFFIVVSLSLAYLYLQNEPKIAAALKGIHAGVTAMILMAAFRMAKVSVFDTATAIVTAAALLILLLINLNPVYVILLGIAAGLCIVKGKERLGIEVRTERTSGSTTLLEPEYFI